MEMVGWAGEPWPPFARPTGGPRPRELLVPHPLCLPSARFGDRQSPPRPVAPPGLSVDPTPMLHLTFRP